ncbi:hypothetical protein GR11A_00242 [Vibrio phage vB_VcorM_GR11A]|nr:hypothetical protein GR11A_00242 [Vibrio phage vB_VcorM_GR11A]
MDIKKAKASEGLQFEKTPKLVAISGKINLKSELGATALFTGSYGHDVNADANVFKGTFQNSAGTDAGAAVLNINEMCDMLSDHFLALAIKKQGVIGQEFTFSAGSTLKAYVEDDGAMVEIDFAKSAGKLLQFIGDVTPYDFSLYNTLETMMRIWVDANEPTTASNEGEGERGETPPIVQVDELPYVEEASLEDKTIPVLPDSDELDGIDTVATDEDEDAAQIIETETSEGFTSVIRKAQGEIVIATGDEDEDWVAYTFDPKEELVTYTEGSGASSEVTYGEAIPAIVAAAREAGDDVLDIISVDGAFAAQVLDVKKQFKAERKKKDRHAQVAKILKLLESTIVPTTVVRHTVQPGNSLNDVKQYLNGYVAQLVHRARQPLMTALEEAYIIGTVVEGSTTVIFNATSAVVITPQGSRETTIADAFDSINLPDAEIQVDHRVLNNELAVDEFGLGDTMQDNTRGLLVLDADSRFNYVTNVQKIGNDIVDAVNAVSEEVSEELDQLDKFLDNDLIGRISEVQAELADVGEETPDFDDEEDGNDEEADK